MKFNISIDVERDLHSGSNEGIEKGLKELDKILSKYNIKATFFVTGESLERYRDLFKDYEKRGYEIAYHGYSHKRIDNCDLEKEFGPIIKGFKIKGFRAPQNSITDKAFVYLKKNNFYYDSSYTPCNFMQILFFPKLISLRHFFSKRIPYKKENILEIPTSSFIFPFGAITLRVFPLLFSKILYYFLNKEIIVFYIHSWDLIELKNSKAYALCNKDCFLKKLDNIINFLQKRGDSILLKDYRLQR